jgi:4-hydroxy-tetrahydrodipicolinate reductase
MGTKNRPKLIVCGAAGRMGRRIIALAVEGARLEIVGAIEKAGQQDIGKDAGIMAGVTELDIIIADDFTMKADVVIDFSLPEATDRTIDYCVKNNAALVLGTTGLSAQQQ